MQTYKLLIVDDAFFIRNLIKKSISKKPNTADYKIEVIGETKNSQEALAFLKNENPDIITVDYNMPPYENGIELIKKIKNKYPNKLILMISEDAAIESSAKELEVEFLMKPFQDSSIWDKLDKLVLNNKFKVENSEITEPVKQPQEFLHEEMVEEILEEKAEFKQANKKKKKKKKKRNDNVLDDLGFEIVGNLQSANLQTKPIGIEQQKPEANNEVLESIETVEEIETVDNVSIVDDFEIIEAVEEKAEIIESEEVFDKDVKPVVVETEENSVGVNPEFTAEMLLNEIDRIFDTDKNILRDLKLKIEFLEYQERMNNFDNVLEEVVNEYKDEIGYVSHETQRENPVNSMESDVLQEKNVTQNNVTENSEINIELPIFEEEHTSETVNEPVNIEFGPVKCDTEYPEDTAFNEEDEIFFDNEIQEEVVIEENEIEETPTVSLENELVIEPQNVNDEELTFILDEKGEQPTPLEEGLENESEEDVFDLLEEAIEDEIVEEVEIETQEPALVDLFKENLETKAEETKDEDTMEFVGDEDEGAQDINEVIKEEEPEENGLIIEEEKFIIDGDDFVTFEEEDPEEYVDQELLENYEDLVIDFTDDEVEVEEHVRTDDEELEELIREASYTLDTHVEVMQPEKAPKSILKLESDDLLNEILNDKYMDEIQDIKKESKPLSEDDLFEKMLEEFETSNKQKEDEIKNEIELNLEKQEEFDASFVDGNFEVDFQKDNFELDIQKEEFDLDIQNVEFELDSPKEEFELDIPSATFELDIQKEIEFNEPKQEFELDIQKEEFDLGIPNIEFELNNPKEEFELNIPNTTFELDTQKEIKFDTSREDFELDIQKEFDLNIQKEAFELDIEKNIFEQDVQVESYPSQEFIFDQESILDETFFSFGKESEDLQKEFINESEKNDVIIPQNEINFDDLLYDNIVIENEPIIEIEKEIVEQKFEQPQQSTFDFDLDSIESLVLDNTVEENKPLEQSQIFVGMEEIVNIDKPEADELNLFVEEPQFENNSLLFNNNEGVTIAPPMRDYRNPKNQIQKESVNNGREDGTNIKQNKSTFGKFFKK